MADIQVSYEEVWEVLQERYPRELEICVLSATVKKQGEYIAALSDKDCSEETTQEIT